MLMMQAEQKGLVNNNVRMISGAGAPTDSTTGAGDCGPGSVYIDITDADWYINAGTLASPTWKLVTRAA